MYYLYILECTDGSFYTGITTEVERRFAEHKAGKGGNYTRAHEVMRVAYTESCVNRSAALKRELAVKALSKEEKLALIRQHQKLSKPR